MNRRAVFLVVLSTVLLERSAFAQSPSVDDLLHRIAELERAVDLQQDIATRNGLLAVALAVGLTAFGLYRQRADSARLTERFGMTDPLTGLKNRRYITQTIDSDCRASVRHYRAAAAAGLPPPADGDLLFLIIDIDRFKSINERLGQAAGDRLLTQIADAIRTTCRTSDTVARWGGEEFLAVLRFTSRNTAAISAERIRMAVEQRVFDLGDGRSAGCTCSIGFAPFPLTPEDPDSATWERVVALADEAMQRAQKSGGNTWVGADVPQPPAVTPGTLGSPGAAWLRLDPRPQASGPRPQ
jgi:diguanylate cyclase (GGDEF)-like protein